MDIVLLVLSAVLCGANDWEEIELFGKSRESWLKKYGSFAHSIPSHDTINRVFSALSPEEFSSCFCRWVNSIRQDFSREVVAIDGKRIRNSHETYRGQSALHMVSAMAVENGLCLGQVATNAKSNEITAIPELLSLLDVKGNIITIDAMGCQRKVVDKIVSCGADYILAVKGNQHSLEEGVKDTCRLSKPQDTHVHTDMGHGRIETRSSSVYADLSCLENANQWKGLRSIVTVESERTQKATGETSKETRYYISNLAGTAKEFNSWIRQHWSIENNLHWSLDVTFREDHSRKRKGHAAHNFNIILKFALSLLVKDNSWKASHKRKRLKAALCEEYRERLLNF
jgi:predicted transposase YbfD/YdcC